MFFIKQFNYWYDEWKIYSDDVLREFNYFNIIKRVRAIASEEACF